MASTVTPKSVPKNASPAAPSTASTRVAITIFAYDPADATQIGDVLKSTNLINYAHVTTAKLSSQTKAACDLALAYLSTNDHLETYLSDVASLHLVLHIPVVYALIHEQRESEIAALKHELATENIISLPVDSQHLCKSLMTSIVSLEIERSKNDKRKEINGSMQSLGEILVNHRIITSLQLKKALDYQSRTGQRLGEVLVELGYIDEDQKLHFLASQLGVAIATPKQYSLAELGVVALIPEHIAKRNHCIALDKNGTDLTVAMVDVLNLRLLDTLRDVVDFVIKPVLGKISDIDTCLERFYRDIASHKEASDLAPQFQETVEFFHEREEQVNLEQIAAAGAEAGIIKVVNTIIANAVRDKASDIHIEPMEKELLVRYRIDGDLRKIMTSSKHTHQAIITRIKILSNLDIAERRLPQDGRMVVRMGLYEVDIRVSILPTVFGEKTVLRILDKNAFERSVTNIGFTQHESDVFKDQIAKPHGMIIVTGPTGSGKSTTLYSAVQEIKHVTKNIVTVEDPVEFHMEGIAQVHVNTKIGLSFAAVLRSILRQDPDIILIGEIRDEETADIAIKMALTGHLVFSTLHTNDAASAIVRFVDIGVPPLLLSSSLNLVVAQRLVRKICPDCRTEYEAPAELLEQLNLQTQERVKFFIGQGCIRCNGTGYSGRTGIFEMISVTKEIRKLILRNAPPMEIQEQAEKEGMRTLRQAGIHLARQGTTSIEQIIAATTEI
ncbi:MAG: Flp pilus assembly complex ATPase component TadA [Chitinivibrionales bacterium]|nr:Flp pilus assembly complex ATPase component TadA [Chitinivibrionales bacterium]